MSDLGNLSQCMVDNDPESRMRARRLRRKALVVSVFIEGLCLGAMLLWPLITPGVLPNGYIVTPLPPYHGGGGATRSHPPRIHTRVDRVPTPPRNEFTYHPNARQRETDANEESAPDIADTAAGFGISSGPGPIGPLIPGGSDSGPAVVLPRPPEAVRPARQKVSEGVMEGALIRRVEPIYPLIARNMRLSGTVRLRAIIATDGSVQNLEVLSGNPILAHAALDAVRQWRYRPTLLSGVPVEVETYITVNFELGGQ